MAEGGNISCHAQEPVNANIATHFSNLTPVQKGVKTFVHFPTVVKQVRRPVSKNGCKNHEISIIFVDPKMS